MSRVEGTLTRYRCLSPSGFGSVWKKLFQELGEMSMTYLAIIVWNTSLYSNLYGSYRCSSCCRDAGSNTYVISSPRPHLITSTLNVCECVCVFHMHISFCCSIHSTTPYVLLFCLFHT